MRGEEDDVLASQRSRWGVIAAHLIGVMTTLLVAGCGSLEDEALREAHPEHRGSVKHFEQLARCKPTTLEAVGNSDGSTRAFCSVGGGGLSLVVSDSPQVLDDAQRTACAPVTLPPGTATPQPLPGHKECYLRGENYLVRNEVAMDERGVVVSKLRPTDVPTLPPRL